MFPQRFDGVPPAVHIHALGEARTRCPRVMGRYTIAAFPLFVPWARGSTAGPGCESRCWWGFGLLLALCAGLLGSGAYIS